MNKRGVIVFGGGTFSPIATHLSLSAPAFGSTARRIANTLKKNKDKFEYVNLILTDMACSHGEELGIRTNEDVKKVVESLLADEDVGVIVMNIAFCDFKFPSGDRNGNRFKTENGPISITLEPDNEKVIDIIRKRRPDIFLVGFKTVTSPADASFDEVTKNMYTVGLKRMKSSKCNLMFVNDTLHRRNMIITPEESHYAHDIGRWEAISMLCEMIELRSSGTFHRTVMHEQENVPFSLFDDKMQEVLKRLIKRGGFICNNGNGFTPGHFCQRTDDISFMSSQRKVDHNRVMDVGVTGVEVVDDILHAYGRTKPSVGARSQWLMFKENPSHKYIIHTHNPLKEGSKIPVRAQYPFQCGSLECGMNTVGGLVEFDHGIKAVFLEKHGANIMFKEETPLEEVWKFIESNIDLGKKVGSE